MSTVPADLGDYSDAELIASVRDGVNAAYGTLYERHVAAAYNLARQLARSSAEADDLVSDAFAKVLDTLRGGKGPDSAFRAYLLTALRHTAYDRTRKDGRLDLTEDMADAGGAVGEALTVPFSDTAVSGLERSLAAKAFARLPERWQAVLWHTEIEQQSAAEVAPILGLTANGVSALAYRAREGLRQAYLQVHLAETEASRCRATADRLGAWTRSGLSKRERSQVESHLDECEHCRALAAELADVNGGLRVVIAPLVLGGAALAYLSTAGAGKATAATAATAGAAAAGAGGAAGSGGAAGAAGAASAGPRQFAGVATSVAAMAAAASVAIAAGGGNQEIPTAAASPPPQPPAQQAPPAQPPAPQPPAPKPPAPKPAPPPQAPPQAPDEPAPAPPPVPEPPAPQPSEAPPPPPPDAPEPAPADVTATTPQDDIVLRPGGPPAELPITVRNDGGTVSEPVVASLNLPPGVHAIRAGGGGGGALGAGAARAAPSQAAAPGPSHTVYCPPSSGNTATCRTEDGLAPGESVVLQFLLVAEEGAQPGKVTGTVNTGATLSISAVPVVIRDVTKLSLAVDQEDSGPPHPSRPWEPWPMSWHWPWQDSLGITVTNTGETAGRVTLTVDAPARASGAEKFDCDPGKSLTCTSTEKLAPGETADMRASLKDTFFPWKRSVTVTATLRSGSGEAQQSETVQIGKWTPPSESPEDERPTIRPLEQESPSTESEDDAEPSKPDKPGHDDPGGEPTSEPDGSTDGPSTTQTTTPEPTETSTPSRPAGDSGEPTTESTTESPTGSPTSSAESSEPDDNGKNGEDHPGRSTPPGKGQRPGPAPAAR